MSGLRVEVVSRALVALALPCLCITGCSAEEHAITIRFSPEELSEDAIDLEVGVVADCGSVSAADEPVAAALWSVRFRRGEPNPSLGPLPSGSYGIYARARSRSCVIVAQGCERVELDSREGADISLLLTAVSDPGCPAGQACPSNPCYVCVESAGRWRWTAAEEDAPCTGSSGAPGICSTDAERDDLLCCTTCWSPISSSDWVCQDEVDPTTCCLTCWFWHDDLQELVCASEVDASRCGAMGSLCHECEAPLACDTATGRCM